MIIGKNKVVAIEYTLKNASDEIIDTSVGAEPLEYLHGYGMLISGLEKELEGKTEGDELSVVIEPAEAYGERREDLIFDVDRSNFEEGSKIEEGMQFEAATPGGRQIVTVVKVSDDKVTIDANHPLAGEKLFFDVKVVNVREATEQELAPASGCGCGCGSSCGDGCGSDGCGCDGGCGCN